MLASDDGMAYARWFPGVSLNFAQNLLRFDELPFTNPAGQVFQEITPLETLEQALEMLDLDAFRKEQNAARAEGRLLGLGVSCYVEPTSMKVGREPTNARL